MEESSQQRKTPYKYLEQKNNKSQEILNAYILLRAYMHKFGVFNAKFNSK